MHMLKYWYFIAYFYHLQNCLMSDKLVFQAKQNKTAFLLAFLIGRGNVLFLYLLQSMCYFY